MNEQEIADILHIPLGQLANYSDDPEVLAAVISLAYQQGINVGLQKAHQRYHTLFADYTEVSIYN